MPTVKKTDKRTGKTTITKTEVKKTSKKASKKSTKKPSVKKIPSKGLIMELDLRLMKSFVSTFVSAEIERIYMVCNGKGIVWLAGYDNSNIAMVSFKLGKLPTTVKAQGVIDTEKFNLYLGTFRGKTFEMSLLPSGKLKLQSGRVKHNMSFLTATVDDIQMFDSIDERGIREYENCYRFNVDSADFEDVIYVGTRLSFMNEIRFKIEGKSLEVSYIPENKVDESTIDLPVDILEEGDASFCLISPKYVKAFSIFTGDFELHVDDEEPLRAIQNMVITDEEYPLRIIVVVASQVESGEAIVASESPEDMLVKDMDIEGEPEEIKIDEEDLEEDEDFDEDDEDDEEIIYDEDDENY